MDMPTRHRRRGRAAALSIIPTTTGPAQATEKICVLALQIERVAELSCGVSWHQIKRALERLQITELFNLKYRALMRNEVAPKTAKILKSLKIPMPRQVIELVEKDPDL
jgi:hypothetical protein